MNSKADILNDEQSYDDSGLEDAIAPALPPEAFRNGRHLTVALNQIASVGQHQPAAIAELIADTLLHMRADYATKLDLINTAIQHNFFKPSSYFKHYFSMIAVRAQLAMNYVLHTADQPHLPNCLEAERILHETKKAIRDSKAKIILC